MALKDKIRIGSDYVFDYPKHFVTLPEYTLRRGARVTVLRQLSQDEADQGEGMERMFEVRMADGWIGSAWASELRRAKTAP